jgi:hypothetical protein
MTDPDHPPDRADAPIASSGVYRLAADDQLEATIAMYAAEGWSTAIVDLRAAADKAAMLDAFARGLGFPAWVGHNWDALDDALGDLSWWPSGPSGRLIVVRGLDRPTVGTARDRTITLDVLDSTTSQTAGASPLIVLLLP